MPPAGHYRPLSWRAIRRPRRSWGCVRGGSSRRAPPAGAHGIARCSVWAYQHWRALFWPAIRPATAAPRSERVVGWSEGWYDIPQGGGENESPTDFRPGKPLTFDHFARSSCVDVESRCPSPAKSMFVWQGTRSSSTDKRKTLKVGGVIQGSYLSKYTGILFRDLRELCSPL